MSVKDYTDKINSLRSEKEDVIDTYGFNSKEVDNINSLIKKNEVLRKICLIDTILAEIPEGISGSVTKGLIDKFKKYMYEFLRSGNQNRKDVDIKLIETKIFIGSFEEDFHSDEWFCEIVSLLDTGSFSKRDNIVKIYNNIYLYHEDVRNPLRISESYVDIEKAYKLLSNVLFGKDTEEVQEERMSTQEKIEQDILESEKQLGKLIKQSRKQAGLSKKELGEITGFSKKEIDKIEKGGTGILYLDELSNIFSVMDKKISLKLVD